jgi:hypothetical protein
MLHPVFQRRPNTHYMCAQDVQTTHIATDMEIIKETILYYISKHSYNKTYNYYKNIEETILNLHFGSPYSTGTVNWGYTRLVFLNSFG